MEWVTILGEMEEDTRVNMNLIRSMAMDLTLGQMEENMLESGQIAKDMAKDESYLLRGIRDKVSGSKTNVFSGWMRAE
jgi:hypothetical protein